MKTYLSLILAILISLTFVSAIMTGTETMTRTPSSTSVSPGSTFTLTYTAVGTSGEWGASIEESASGGCTFPSGSSTYKTVMLSEDGNTKTITMIAPASGSCTISGNYLYGSFSAKNFADSIINIGTTCIPSCSGKVCGNDGCGGTCGTCESGKTCQSGQCITGTCTPDNSCASTTCTGQTCTNNCETAIAGTKSCGSSCTNGVKDGDETNIDCGGSCSACTQAKFCIDFTNDLLSKYTGSIDCQTNTLWFLGIIVGIIIIIVLLK